MGVRNKSLATMGTITTPKLLMNAPAPKAVVKCNPIIQLIIAAPRTKPV